MVTTDIYNTVTIVRVSDSFFTGFFRKEAEKTET